MIGLRGIARAAALRVPAVARLLAELQRLAAENETLRQAQSRTPVRAPAIGPLSTLVDPRHYDDADWIALHCDLERYSIDKHCFQNVEGEIYRKGWEWTHCLYGLRALGAITPDARGLGVGAGREAVIFWLADHVGRVTATDLYDDAVWSTAGGREADRSLVDEALAACPPSVERGKIAFERQDGTALGYGDASFDFAWSLSSIEHFGGHSGATAAMREMARVVRPGGIVAVATELLLLDEHRHPEFFTRRELMEAIVHATPRLELIGPIAFDTLPREYLLDQIVIPAGADRRRRHVVLNDGAVQFTSVLLFLRVRG